MGRDALRYGATSPQPDRGTTIIPEPVIAGDNELNLNVFTPDLGGARLPVLVWIHGGGFFGGGNASPWYRGSAFARDGVVLVSINYRLGAEGFLELPGAPTNRAVRDWVRALEWVQENIEGFGGDPGKVTIAGQSAGAAACATLLAVPAARGLFRHADIVGQALTDRTFRVPAQEMAAAKASAGGAAYVYDFRWSSPVSAFGGLSFHCLDVPFVFDALGEPGVKEVAGDAPPAGLAHDIHQAWVRFVTDGQPGWSGYDLSARPVMVFAVTSGPQDDPLRAEREAWSSR